MSERCSKKIELDACSRILIAHAMGGCDSTSAIFGMGKGTIFTRLNADATLHADCRILQSETASAAEVNAAGVRVIAGLYGGKRDESLTAMRYTAFCNATISHRFTAERLPPSENAAKLHAERVHLQAVIWSTLDQTSLLATDWGWRLAQGRLVPIPLEGPVTPDFVLNVVRCKCKGSCASTSCSCCKHGLSCVTVCSNCRGTDCKNVKVDDVTVTGDDGESDDDSPEPLAEELFPEDLGEFFLDDDFF
jgi:hypothetical protein